ncbi:MAG: YdeI/OmpD-associated family protein [Bacteroidia bacterium]|nr:YdeI/OmpD-associated family protein [Bacteroidia bacterium]
MEKLNMDGIYHKIPKDALKMLGIQKLIHYWVNLTDIQRNEWICWLESAKRQETRNKRLERMIKDLKNGKKRPCCWPGCHHHNPNLKKWHTSTIK